MPSGIISTAGPICLSGHGDRTDGQSCACDQDCRQDAASGFRSYCSSAGIVSNQGKCTNGQPGSACQNDQDCAVLLDHVSYCRDNKCNRFQKFEDGHACARDLDCHSGHCNNPSEQPGVMTGTCGASDVCQCDPASWVETGFGRQACRSEADRCGILNMGDMLGITFAGDESTSKSNWSTYKVPEGQPYKSFPEIDSQDWFGACTQQSNFVLPQWTCGNSTNDSKCNMQQWCENSCTGPLFQPNRSHMLVQKDGDQCHFMFANCSCA